MRDTTPFAPRLPLYRCYIIGTRSVDGAYFRAYTGVDAAFAFARAFGLEPEAVIVIHCGEGK